jgi:hypothetical protein
MEPIEKSDEVLRRAILKWGSPVQLDMAIEETAELQKAICKLKRSTSANEPKCILDILDEVAHVEIMCQQLRIMFDTEDQVNAIKRLKIQRLENRLNNPNPQKQ